MLAFYATQIYVIGCSRKFLHNKNYETINERYFIPINAFKNLDKIRQIIVMIQVQLGCLKTKSKKHSRGNWHGAKLKTLAYKILIFFQQAEQLIVQFPGYSWFQFHSIFLSIYNFLQYFFPQAHNQTKQIALNPLSETITKF